MSLELLETKKKVGDYGIKFMDTQQLTDGLIEMTLKEKEELLLDIRSSTQMIKESLYGYQVEERDFAKKTVNLTEKKQGNSK